MNFERSSDVDQVCWQFKLADYTRGLNRAKINDLFNGKPPYTDDEVRDNNIAVNVNFLEQTRLAHDARSQFYSAFTKPGNYFGAKLERGPQHKRSRISSVVTSEVNRTMRKSMFYFETLRSCIALGVLHGIGPSAYDDSDIWCPDALGVEDVLMPSGTLLTMRDLPFFAIYRSYTAPKLMRMTQGAKVDKAWNMKLVQKCLNWIDKESTSLMGSNWQEVWSPEKQAERMKGDSCIYASDAVPTIEVFDFYFWKEDPKPGWRRRMIIDSWGQPGVGGISREDPIGSAGEFLFDSKDRIYGEHLHEIINFQFADLSAVGPFRYHSVRSLGFLLYGLSHLQNRLRCKFNESVFESLMQYFRVRNADDVERALKIELINRGVIDESVEFIGKEQRWQTDAGLVELGLRHNQQLITEHSAGYTQAQNYSQNNVEKTKFQVMAELNAMTAMVSAAIQQAYRYHEVQCCEIFRRFMKKNSRDREVQETRERILKRGVPEEVLYYDYYEITPEKIMGAGNKSLEMAISEQLMQYRPLFDPEPQREILRDVTLAITDDPDRAMRLVPEARNQVSDAKHDAQLATASILMGLPVDVKSGMNQIDYIEALLRNYTMMVQKIEAQGGMANPQQIDGLTNLSKHIQQHLQILAQDPNEKQRVRKYADDLKELDNMVKAYQQRLMQQMKAEQQKAAQNGGMDPEQQAKIQATMMQAQTKNQLAQQSHSQRTAQRAVQFEKQMEQQQRKADADLANEGRKANLEMRKKAQETNLDMQTQAVKTRFDIQKERAKTDAKIQNEKAKQASEAESEGSEE